MYGNVLYLLFYIMIKLMNVWALPDPGPESKAKHCEKVNSLYMVIGECHTGYWLSVSVISVYTANDDEAFRRNRIFSTATDCCLSSLGVFFMRLYTAFIAILVYCIIIIIIILLSNCTGGVIQ